MRHGTSSSVVELVTTSISLPCRCSLLGTQGCGELVRALLPYSERHFQRLDRLLQSSYLVEHTLASMQMLVASKNATAEKETHEPRGIGLNRPLVRELKRLREDAEKSKNISVGQSPANKVSGSDSDGDSLGELEIPATEVVDGRMVFNVTVDRAKAPGSVQSIDDDSNSSDYGRDQEMVEADGSEDIAKEKVLSQRSKTRGDGKERKRRTLEMNSKMHSGATGSTGAEGDEGDQVALPSMPKTARKKRRKREAACGAEGHEASRVRPNEQASASPVPHLIGDVSSSSKSKASHATRLRHDREWGRDQELGVEGNKLNLEDGKDTGEDKAEKPAVGESHADGKSKKKRRRKSSPATIVSSVEPSLPAVVVERDAEDTPKVNPSCKKKSAKSSSKPIEVQDAVEKNASVTEIEPKKKSSKNHRRKSSVH